ncbi:hypothetical protein E2C01_036598 [Portunus trituberculatus]|uniref:Uncharacterized protein n=1 Tax=Portunus trituberculatus TaxID=210409 RepID=A0A5B7FCW9_PORTR|nr:hypothetical protein [Portunus trituberculatus]
MHAICEYWRVPGTNFRLAQSKDPPHPPAMLCYIGMEVRLVGAGQVKFPYLSAVTFLLMFSATLPSCCPPNLSVTLPAFLLPS